MPCHAMLCQARVSRFSARGDNEGPESHKYEETADVFGSWECGTLDAIESEEPAHALLMLLEVLAQHSTAQHSIA